jgi:hypothetical protein
MSVPYLTKLHVPFKFKKCNNSNQIISILTPSSNRLRKISSGRFINNERNERKNILDKISSSVKSNIIIIITTDTLDITDYDEFSTQLITNDFITMVIKPVNVSDKITTSAKDIEQKIKTELLVNYRTNLIVDKIFVLCHGTSYKYGIHIHNTSTIKNELKTILLDPTKSKMLLIKSQTNTNQHKLTKKIPTNPSKNISTNLSNIVSTNPSKNLSTDPKNLSTNPSKNISTDPKNISTNPSKNVSTNQSGPTNSVLTDPSNSVLTNPSNSVLTNPSKNVSTNQSNPTNSVLTDPSNSVLTNPSKSVLTNPSKSVLTNPSKSVLTNPSKSVLTNPPKSILTNPPENILANSSNITPAILQKIITNNLSQLLKTTNSLKSTDTSKRLNTSRSLKTERPIKLLEQSSKRNIAEHASKLLCNHTNVNVESVRTFGDKSSGDNSVELKSLMLIRTKNKVIDDSIMNNIKNVITNVQNLSDVVFDLKSFHSNLAATDKQTDMIEKVVDVIKDFFV